MTTWLPRGLVFAAGMVLLRLVQGTLINTYPTKAGTISVVLVALFWVGALAWGFLDGVADARANPDPDRRRDQALRWLVAGLVAGGISGFVVWLISLVYHNLYADGIVSEVTVFSAFTALAVFLPAMLAVAVGRWVVDRNRPEEHLRLAEDGSEIDVFDVVRDDDRTGPIPPIPAGAAAPSAVALAEREEREVETDQITAQIQDEAQRIDTEIDRIVGKDDGKS